MSCPIDEPLRKWEDVSHTSCLVKGLMYFILILVCVCHWLNLNLVACFLLKEHSEVVLALHLEVVGFEFDYCHCIHCSYLWHVLSPGWWKANWTYLRLRTMMEIMIMTDGDEDSAIMLWLKSSVSHWYVNVVNSAFDVGLQSVLICYISHFGRNKQK